MQTLQRERQLAGGATYRCWDVRDGRSPDSRDRGDGLHVGTGGGGGEGRTQAETTIRASARRHLSRPAHARAHTHTLPSSRSPLCLTLHTRRVIATLRTRSAARAESAVPIRTTRCCSRARRDLAAASLLTAYGLHHEATPEKRDASLVEESCPEVSRTSRRDASTWTGGRLSPRPSTIKSTL